MNTKNMYKLGFSILSIFRNQFFPVRIKNYKNLKTNLQGKYGLEIGGPSKIFQHRGLIPLYRYVKRLDNCNFSKETIWEKNLVPGGKFTDEKGRILGMQYVLEANNLKGIRSETYDFVISSHTLEHVANPLKAIMEWNRVIKPGGFLLIIVPDKYGTFDHKRTITKFSHFVSDYKKDVTEKDLTHLQEILKKHDLTKDPQAGDIINFKNRSLKNFENRALHHHVFCIDVLRSLFVFLGLINISLITFPPYHIIVSGYKRNSL